MFRDTFRRSTKSAPANVRLTRVAALPFRNSGRPARRNDVPPFHNRPELAAVHQPGCRGRGRRHNRPCSSRGCYPMRPARWRCRGGRRQCRAGVFATAVRDHTQGSRRWQIALIAPISGCEHRYGTARCVRPDQIRAAPDCAVRGAHRVRPLRKRGSATGFCACVRLRPTRLLLQSVARKAGVQHKCLGGQEAPRMSSFVKTSASPHFGYPPAWINRPTRPCPDPLCASC